MDSENQHKKKPRIAYLKEKILALSQEEKKALLEKIKSGDLPRKIPDVDYHKFSWKEADGEARYEVDLNSVKRGGMARVYRAKDVRHGRNVAIKVMEPFYLDDEFYNKLIALEAKNMARLSSQHPAIPHVFDFLYAPEPTDSKTAESTEKLPIMIMEWIDPETTPTLREYIKERIETSLEQLLTIIDQVADAVDFMAEQGVFHSDLKPGNIFVSKENLENKQIKVSDFGLNSLSIERAFEHSGEDKQDKTVGTPSYMSPEAVKKGGGAEDLTSEVFSLGIIIYQMITGNMPFKVETADGYIDPFDQAIKNAYGSFLSITDAKKPFGVDSLLNLEDLEKIDKEKLQAFFEKALNNKEPDKRFQTATQMAKELRKIIKP